jgi:hypothetical protein
MPKRVRSNAKPEDFFFKYIHMLLAKQKKEAW